MDRIELERLIRDDYSAEPDHPWISHPNYAVFRHGNNQKWFALIMDIPRNKLGFRETDVLDVVNLKCDPLLIGSLLKEPGFFPAYHMSKGGWITAALDGSASDEALKALLAMSYDATASKARGRSG